MHKMDQFGRIINQYGQEMGFGNYYNNWNNPITKQEIKVKEPKENKHKYLLIRR
jgi:hypothetical protein